MLLRYAPFVLAIVLFVGGCAALSTDSSAQLSFDQGLSALSSGDYGAAVNHFQHAIQLEPEWAEAHLNLGRAFLGGGDYLKALQPLRTAYSLSPGMVREEAVGLLVDAFIGGASKNLMQGDVAGSLDLLQEGLNLTEPGSDLRGKLFGAMLSNGKDLMAKGNFGGAAQMLSTMVKAGPASGMKLDALLSLAGAYLRMGDYSQAVDAARDAAGLNPNLGSPMELLGRLR